MHREDRDEDEADEQEDEGSIIFMPKIDELENLLEAYFVQIDGTLNKLSTVSTSILRPNRRTRSRMS